jgi:DNA-3-methyladenine glycosylase II
VDADTLAEGVAHLVAVDPDLARITARNGPPPAWRRPEGFATLVILVLEQQVSLASAAAAYRRLVDVLGGPPQPEAFLGLDDLALRAIGFSRQKASYVRGIAAALEAGQLRLDDLGSCDDDTVRSRLTAVRGIGPWTAECYLLSALGRPDVWPTGDRALHVALVGVKGLSEPPDAETAVELAASWRPWRAVAARMLWHDYVGGSIPPGMG